MKLSNFLEEEEFLPNISCKGKIKHSVNPTYDYKSKSGNGLDLDSIFQTLGPCQSLGPIFQGSIVLCWQIYEKTLYDFSISKVMAVCINTHACICDEWSYCKITLSRADSNLNATIYSIPRY